MADRPSEERSEIAARVRSASIVTLTGFVANQVMRLAGNLILTRLLLPEYFGIMGMVTVILTGVVMFSDLGIRQSVVRSESGEKDDFLDTAWTVQCIRGLLLSIAVILIGYGLGVAQNLGYLSGGSVYGDPLLPKVLLVISILPLLAGMESTYVYVANRQLQMSKVIGSELISQFIGLIVMVVGATLTMSIWAIVAGSIVSSVSKTLLTHLLFLPKRVRWHFSGAYVREIIEYGKWILLASVSGFLLNQGDRLILGGLVSAQVLGVYSIAYFLASAMQLGLSRLLRIVFFPMLSEVHRLEPEKVASVYYRIRMRTDILVMFGAGFLYIIGDTIIEILYDSRYHDAGWMLEVLGFSMLVTGPIVAEQVFLALGHSRWMSLASISQTVFMYAMIPMAYSFWGLYGAIWVIAFAFVPKYVVSLYFLHRLSIVSLMKEIRFMPLIVVGMLLAMLLEHMIDFFRM